MEHVKPRLRQPCKVSSSAILSNMIILPEAAPSFTNVYAIGIFINLRLVEIHWYDENTTSRLFQDTMQFAHRFSIIAHMLQDMGTDKEIDTLVRKAVHVHNIEVIIHLLHISIRRLVISFGEILTNKER